MVVRTGAWGLEANECYTWLQKEEKKRAQGTARCQSHLSPWNTSFGRSSLSTWMTRGDQEQSTRIHNDKSFLTNLSAFNNEKTTWMGEGRAVDIFCLDFCKPFNIFTQNIRIGKFRKRGLDEWTVRWIELNGRSQTGCVAGSSWKPVIKGATQGSVLGLLFNLFINDLEEGTDASLAS